MTFCSQIQEEALRRQREQEIALRRQREEEERQQQEEALRRLEERRREEEERRQREELIRKQVKNGKRDLLNLIMEAARTNKLWDFHLCLRNHSFWWRKAKLIDRIKWMKNRLFTCILISDETIRIQFALWKRDLCWMRVFFSVWALRMALQQVISTSFSKTKAEDCTRKRVIYFELSFWVFTMDLLSLTLSEMSRCFILSVLGQDYTHYQSFQLFSSLSFLFFVFFNC